MKAVTLLVCVMLVAAVSASASSEEKPKSSKKLVSPIVIGSHSVLPKSRVVIVPRGDPRARPPTASVAPAVTPAAPALVPAVAPASPMTSTVLKSSAPTTSAACKAKKGTCKASSSCTGNFSVVKGLCSGSASITCCVPKAAASTPAPSTPSSTSNCPVYGNSATRSIKGNGGKMYAVVPIAKQHFTGSADNTMTKPTACAFARMAEAAAKAGVKLTINSGFRTYERQQYFWNCYQTKKCNNGNLAAKPGNSNHGRGQALDIQVGAASSKTYKWMAANAGKYGFRRTVPSELWHWEHA